MSRWTLPISLLRRRSRTPNLSQATVNCLLRKTATVTEMKSSPDLYDLIYFILSTECDYHTHKINGSQQKFKKSRFLTCHCHKIYREEAVGLKCSNSTYYDFFEYVNFATIREKFDILLTTALLTLIKVPKLLFTPVCAQGGGEGCFHLDPTIVRYIPVGVFGTKLTQHLYTPKTALNQLMNSK